MKTLIVLLTISLFLFDAAFAQTNGIKINSYFIGVKVDKDSNQVNVNLSCNITANENMANTQFIFSTAARIKSIDCRKGSEWIGLPYSQNGRDSLTLTTKDIFTSGHDYQLKFEYSFPTGKFNDTLLMLDRGHRWYPLIMDQIASFKVTCEVASGYGVLSAGDFVSKIEGERNIFVFESRIPVFKIPLLIFNLAKYKKVSDKYSDLYYFSVDSKKASSLLNKTKKAMDYYKITLGIYPHKKLTMIEVKEFPGINTCSGLLMIGSQSLEAIIGGDDDIIALTVAQQWFGAGVFAKYGGNGFYFLSITLPNYLRLMFTRYNKDESQFNKVLKQSIASYKEIAGTEKDIPINNIDMVNTREKGLALYAKGPYILNLIEKEMGRNKWTDFLRALYKDYKGSILTYEDFEKYLAKNDRKGKALPLLRKLLNEKGIPD